MTELPLLDEIKVMFRALRADMKRQFDRYVSTGDLIVDRWEIAREYGFGNNSSCYDNTLIRGDVRVGRDTWIGPNCILDGVGGLNIGYFCSISAGVQIYTHHTVGWSTSMGESDEERAPVTIGSGVYLGPQSVIQMGVTIGDRAVIGALSFVDTDIPAGARAWGCPARVIDS